MRKLFMFMYLLNIETRIFEPLFWVWQLPQHILAGILSIVWKNKTVTQMTYKETTVHLISNWYYSGLSLGYHIFLPKNYQSNSLIHEYGHTIQSLKWGPLYLFIPGLTSLTLNILSTISYRRFEGNFATNYYNRWPEKQADSLGKEFS